MKKSLSGLGLLLFALVACAPSPEEAEPSGPEYYDGVGTVVGIEEGKVLIDHEEIPGFMDAMTMTFPLADPVLLKDVEEGSRVSFRVEVEGTSYRIVELELSRP